MEPQQKPAVPIPEQKMVGTNNLKGYQKPSETTPSPGQPVVGATTLGVSPITYQKVNAQKQATSQFSKNVVPPLPATRENVVVGQVLDEFGQIVEGTILEIKDTNGRPVRALKSNKLGHFMIATPLVSGEYSIQAEKEGYQFEPYTFKAENKIIPPIAIWATKGGMKKEDPMSNMSNEDKEFIKDFNI